MITRHAACSCGQLHLTTQGEPSRIAMCHCIECQRHTGAGSAIKRAFAATKLLSPVNQLNGCGQPKAATQ